MQCISKISAYLYSCIVALEHQAVIVFIFVFVQLSLLFKRENKMALLKMVFADRVHRHLWPIF